MTETIQKKPTAGFWGTAALVVALVAYPLSFGPACWISSQTHVGVSAVTAVYQPIVVAVYWSRSVSLATALHWYAELGAEHRWVWATRSTGRVEWTSPAVEELPPGF